MFRPKEQPAVPHKTKPPEARRRMEPEQTIRLFAPEELHRDSPRELPHCRDSTDPALHKDLSPELERRMDWTGPKLRMDWRVASSRSRSRIHKDWPQQGWGRHRDLLPERGHHKDSPQQEPLHRKDSTHRTSKRQLGLEPTLKGEARGSHQQERAEELRSHRTLQHQIYLYQGWELQPPHKGSGLRRDR